MSDSLLHRKLRGPLADWDMSALLLRNIEFGIRGLQWQNAGKGPKPKPIPLPEDKARTSQPASSGPAPDVVQRLQNLGMVPADTSD
jgi:hypothetical protein